MPTRDILEILANWGRAEVGDSPDETLRLRKAWLPSYPLVLAQFSDPPWMVSWIWDNRLRGVERRSL